MSSVSGENEVLLADAVEDCLKNVGVAILCEPQRFVSLLRDAYGGQKSPEMEVLSRNCDGELLQFFVEATSVSHPSTDSLQEATSATSTLLQEERLITSDIADSVANQLMAGIARYLDGKEKDSSVIAPAGDLPIGGIDKAVRPSDTVASGREMDMVSKEQTDSMTLSDYFELYEEDGRPSGVMPPGQETDTMKASSSADDLASESKKDDASESVSKPATSTASNSPSASEPKGSSGRPQKTLVIVAVALVAIAAIAFLVFSASVPSKTITLYDFDSDKNEKQEIEGRQGGTVVLPDPSVEYDGYVFAGWVPMESLDDEDVMEPGTEVNVDDHSAYRAVWNPLVSFDGNGADLGSMEPIVAGSGGHFELPEPEYTKEGYLFSGWSTDKDGGYVEQSDAESYVVEPTTYYAIWIPQLVIGYASVTDLNGVSGTIEGWDSTMGAAVLVVTNDTDQTLVMDAAIAELSKSGNKLEESYGYYCGVGPGESRLLSMYSTEKSGATATYAITVEPDSFNASIASQITDEVISIDKNELCLKITNTGDEEAYIGDIGLIAVDDLGAQRVANSYLSMSLKPGESGEAVFDMDSMVVYGQKVPDWTKVEYSLYVDGFKFAL